MHRHSGSHAKYTHILYLYCGLLILEGERWIWHASCLSSSTEAVSVNSLLSVVQAQRVISTQGQWQHLSSVSTHSSMFRACLKFLRQSLTICQRLSTILWSRPSLQLELKVCAKKYFWNTCFVFFLLVFLFRYFSVYVGICI